MTSRLPPFWELQNFGERFDSWVDTEQPDGALRALVLDWILGRHDDPYRDVHRTEIAPNLWFGQIPRSLHGDRVVVCGYWIFEQDRRVRCDSLATLSVPF